MRIRELRAFLVLAAVCLAADAEQKEEFLITAGTPGRYGGQLVVSERSQPKTLNPVTAIDGVSRDAIQLMTADLVHIDRDRKTTEPALAREWTVSADKRSYLLHLRRGIRFSDGHPFDADDVVFTFQVYLDEKTHSPQRDLLVVAGRPVGVRKLDQYTVVIEAVQPYAPGERLFDSIAILPRHLLLKQYTDGKITDAWSLNISSSQIAGLGPFRFSEYVPGRKLVLERNPYYWKTDSKNNRLPWLNNVIFHYVGSEDAQVLGFRTGGTDVISRLNSRDFEVLAREKSKTRKLIDLGPGLEYNFLFFNLNDVSTRGLAGVGRKQQWFRDVNFRKAISRAIDREGIARLAYAGKAAPIWGPVTPGNEPWIERAVPTPARSVEAARILLASGGFTWNKQGNLIDRKGNDVAFTVITNAGNTEREQTALIIQQDLAAVGITVQVVPLEFRSMIDRVTNTFDYDACVLGLSSGDIDPSSDMNVWRSSGSTHLWHLNQTAPETHWEAEIDRLMDAQMTSSSSAERKRLYGRVQQLIAEFLPIICLVSPNILAGARADLMNFRPAIMLPYTLWNAEELFWRDTGGHR